MILSFGINSSVPIGNIAEITKIIDSIPDTLDEAHRIGLKEVYLSGNWATPSNVRFVDLPGDGHEGQGLNTQDVLEKANIVIWVGHRLPGDFVSSISR